MIGRRRTGARARVEHERLVEGEAADTGARAHAARWGRAGGRRPSRTSRPPRRPPAGRSAGPRSGRETAAGYWEGARPMTRRANTPPFSPHDERRPRGVHGHARAAGVGARRVRGGDVRGPLDGRPRRPLQPSEADVRAAAAQPTPDREGGAVDAHVEVEAAGRRARRVTHQGRSGEGLEAGARWCEGAEDARAADPGDGDAPAVRDADRGLLRTSRIPVSSRSAGRHAPPARRETNTCGVPSTTRRQTTAPVPSRAMSRSSTATTSALGPSSASPGNQAACAAAGARRARTTARRSGERRRGMDSGETRGRRWQPGGGGKVTARARRRGAGRPLSRGARRPPRAAPARARASPRAPRRGGPTRARARRRRCRTPPGPPASAAPPGVRQ